ncbi:Tol biopolymer transport system component [Algoriphagus sp. 4150]|uniref:TolB family protein n=1 Tax=Algoriphagus sp. 4150 TaxID=2817756 RepID=UPI002856B979|nr:sialidase family protein [Algoriphagus sp. 4150]MDR7127905.1 Tol biopolymer transport system component [Algoriphagus sp. 4150]
MKCIKFLSLLFLISQLSCRSTKNDSDIKGIDLHVTSSTPHLFAEGLVSTPFYERDMAISPAGDEVVFTRGDYKQNYRFLISIKKRKGEWGKPEVLNISGVFQDIEPFFGTDGNRLYFASNRPIYGDSSRSDFNIWYSDRADAGWAEPVPLDSIINTSGDEFYPSLSSKGNLFFTATRPNGIGKEDIFMSELVDGKYLSPEPLPEEINTSFYEFNAFISPNEDYILFCSYGRADDLGRGDLYISQKDASGKWMEARNLGAKVNSPFLDFCPFVDWEERNLYFTSERVTAVTPKIGNFEELQQLYNSTENGFGNIYQISFDELGIELNRMQE